MEDTQRVIVFEGKPYWQPELQRRFLNESVEVGACRSVRDLEMRIRSEPANVVVLELAADLEGSLRWLGHREQASDRTPVIVAATAAQSHLVWRLRELGATSVVHELIGGGRMAAVCRKLWSL